MLLFILKSDGSKITSVMSSSAFGRNTQLGKRLLFYSFSQQTLQFCLCSHKSFIDVAEVSWCQVQDGKLMEVVGGLLQMSVAAEYHKGFIRDICFLAQVRVDFTVVLFLFYCIC